MSIGNKPKVVVTGASGFVGSGLVPFLTQKGFDVYSLVRSSPKNTGEIFWNPYENKIDLQKLEGTDCFIHLSGESIASRWTARKKKEIRDSRVASTKFLVDCFEKLSDKPKSFLCGSAVGYYGNGGSQELTETSPNGTDFLAAVCREWETEAARAQFFGVRTVSFRLGLVLARHGGALQKIYPIFKLGLGGKLGDGRQWMSWIAYEDVLAALYYCMTTSSLLGPVNFCSPEPVTNEEFTKALGKALHRPTMFPVPSSILQLLLGEMAEETLLASQKVMPTVLLNSAFEFSHSNLSLFFDGLFWRP